MKDRIRYRLNGILKNEYYLDAQFKTKEEAREAIKTAIWTYNHRSVNVPYKLTLDKIMMVLSD